MDISLFKGLKKDIVWENFFVSFFIFGLIFVVFLTPLPEIIGDHALYINLATSLSAGLGFKDICYPDNPPHVEYTPPLFPIFLAPLIYLYGYNPFILKLAMMVIDIASLFLLNLLFINKFVLDKKIELFIIVLFSISKCFFMYSYAVLPEVLYLFFSLLTILFLLQKGKINFYDMVLAIFCSLAAFLTRYVGITLIIAIVLFSVLEKSKLEKNISFVRYLFLIMLLVIFVIFLDFFIFQYNLRWGWRNASVSKLNVILTNIYAITFYALPQNLTGLNFSSRSLLAAILSLLCGYGFIYCLIKKRTFLEYYVMTYIILLLFYCPFAYHGTRYLMPLLPFLFYYFFKSIEIISSFLSAKFLLIALFFVLFIINIFSTVSYAYNQRKNEIQQFLKMTEVIKNTSSQTEILGTINPHIVYLFTKRKTYYILTKSVLSENILQKFDYLVIEPFSPYTTEKFLLPFVEKYYNKFVLIYKDGNFKFYKVKK
jgi:hypothetical protein